jgi:hypothetical protein
MDGGDITDFIQSSVSHTNMEMFIYVDFNEAA